MTSVCVNVPNVVDLELVVAHTTTQKPNLWLSALSNKSTHCGKQLPPVLYSDCHPDKWKYSTTSVWKLKYTHPPVHLYRTKNNSPVLFFPIWLKSSLLGQKCSSWTKAFSWESHSTKRRWRTASDKLTEVAVELAGLRKTQSFSRQTAEKSEWVYNRLSSCSSTSSGLPRLLLHNKTELKHTCTLGVFRSCLKYACIPMFCTIRETTSCHIVLSLPPF